MEHNHPRRADEMCQCDTCRAKDAITYGASVAGEPITIPFDVPHAQLSGITNTYPTSWEGGPIWVVRGDHAQTAFFNLVAAERYRDGLRHPENWQVVKYVQEKK